jgi:hypothetical protein
MLGREECNLGAMVPSGGGPDAAGGGWGGPDGVGGGAEGTEGDFATRMSRLAPTEEVEEGLKLREEYGLPVLRTPPPPPPRVPQLASFAGGDGTDSFESFVAGTGFLVLVVVVSKAFCFWDCCCWASGTAACVAQGATEDAEVLRIESLFFSREAFSKGDAAWVENSGRDWWRREAPEMKGGWIFFFFAAAEPFLASSTKDMLLSLRFSLFF